MAGKSNIHRNQRYCVSDIPVWRGKTEADRDFPATLLVPGMELCRALKICLFLSRLNWIATPRSKLPWRSAHKHKAVSNKSCSGTDALLKNLWPLKWIAADGNKAASDEFDGREMLNVKATGRTRLVLLLVQYHHHTNSR
jgi:hypothetical protein